MCFLLRDALGLELIPPTTDHQSIVWDYRQEHIDRAEPTIHGSMGLMRAENYAGWLDMVKKASMDEMPGYVMGDIYLAIVEGRIVGMMSVRHRLNEMLMNIGGHIGYGVRPSERRKGYAVRMLKLALERYRELGMDRVLVTCNRDNAASARVILRCGGVMENEFIEENGNVIQRYWIALL